MSFYDIRVFFFCLIHFKFPITIMMHSFQIQLQGNYFALGVTVSHRQRKFVVSSLFKM